MDTTTPEDSSTAEDTTASNWRSALGAEDGSFDESELPWYGNGSPQYGPDAATPAQIEAARRFVSHWLEGDNHGFIIPGSEWGRSLKHWLNILASVPAPGGEALSSRDDSESRRFPDSSYSLLEQVRSREIAPSHWIHMLRFENAQFHDDFSAEDISSALDEAIRMRNSDELETRRMLGRN